VIIGFLLLRYCGHKYCASLGEEIKGLELKSDLNSELWTRRLVMATQFEQQKVRVIQEKPMYFLDSHT
jgi:hypothetical protein